MSGAAFVHFGFNAQAEQSFLLALYLIHLAGAWELCPAWTNGDVAFRVEDEVSPAKGAGEAIYPVPELRRDVSIHQGLAHACSRADQMASSWHHSSKARSARTCSRPLAIWDLSKRADRPYRAGRSKDWLNWIEDLAVPRVVPYDEFVPTAGNTTQIAFGTAVGLRQILRAQDGQQMEVDLERRLKSGERRKVVVRANITGVFATYKTLVLVSPRDGQALAGRARLARIHCRSRCC